MAFLLPFMENGNTIAVPVGEFSHETNESYENDTQQKNVLCGKVLERHAVSHVPTACTYQSRLSAASDNCFQLYRRNWWYGERDEVALDGYNVCPRACAIGSSVDYCFPL
ncbi:hypothetical protein EVAR_97003_1 [Eumeta japonica]|uniref:Uncharacterized protein n=1 Tax=Eumeta variegata TaxID=151549 RepID=A0A4C1ZZC0_EUMVA|nr:hypothetical protein EVAR_97003_1 [Eumeta japonica]